MIPPLTGVGVIRPLTVREQDSPTITRLLARLRRLPSKKLSFTSCSLYAFGALFLPFESLSHNHSFQMLLCFHLQRSEPTKAYIKYSAGASFDKNGMIGAFQKNGCGNRIRTSQGFIRRLEPEGLPGGRRFKKKPDFRRVLISLI